MMMTLIMMVMSTLMSMFLMMTSLILSKKQKKDMQKMSPFECGFDPKSSARMPFSIQFFMIAILFLIFDIEIIIIIPMIITMKMSMWSTWMLTTMMFIIILIIGLLHEWKMKTLEWAK